MRISLVRPRKDKPVTDDICTYGTEVETYNNEYLTGKASQR